MEPKYPGIQVPLVGADGNAFAIIGAVRRVMRRAGISREEIRAFSREATSGNYDNLLRTCMRWVTVE